MKQYANSPVICALIENFKHYLNADRAQDDFYNKIWNLDTAIGYGLDIWGRIVGIERYMAIKSKIDAFGFDTADNSWFGFDQMPFYPDEESSNVFKLGDRAYRELILAKAMANISSSSAQDINRILSLLFNNRKAYVLDMGKMQMRYVFRFDLEPYEKEIIFNEKVFAHPAGVEKEIRIIPDYIFGFDGSGLQPFDQGIFYEDE